MDGGWRETLRSGRRGHLAHAALPGQPHLSCAPLHRNAGAALCRSLPLPPESHRARRAPQPAACPSAGPWRRHGRDRRLGACQLVRHPRSGPRYAYSWGRQNWFANAAAEHAAIRGGVGMYDMSSFGKLRVEGPEAEAFLNHVCGADTSVPVGKIVYTQFLNERGGIEADVTVTRLSETAYLVVTPAGTRLADETWLRRHLGDHSAVITDVTAGEGVLAVMGPRAREVMQAVSPNDFSNDAHPFGHARQIEIGMGLARRIGCLTWVSWAGRFT